MNILEINVPKIVFTLSLSLEREEVGTIPDTECEPGQTIDIAVSVTLIIVMQFKSWFAL